MKSNAKAPLFAGPQQRRPDSKPSLGPQPMPVFDPKKAFLPLVNVTADAPPVEESK